MVYAADRILQRGNLLIAGFAFSDEFLLGDRAGYAQVNQLRALIFDGLNLLPIKWSYAVAKASKGVLDPKSGISETEIPISVNIARSSG